MKLSALAILVTSALGAQDALVPLAFGLALPRIEGNNSHLSMSNVPTNWKHVTCDFTFQGQQAKRDIIMHGSAGAVGYLHMRNTGHGVYSFTGAFITGLGIELGQSFEAGHTVSLGDIARTALYGTIFGELAFRVSRWALEEYRLTGNFGYKILATMVNPEHLIISPSTTGAVIGIHFSW